MYLQNNLISQLASIDNKEVRIETNKIKNVENPAIGQGSGLE